MNSIIPCLWFDDNAEDAVEFYLYRISTDIFLLHNVRHKRI